MKKRILSIMLALALAAGTVSSAGLVNMSATGIVTVNNVKVAQAAKKKVKAPSLKKIHKAIVNAYGDEFVANVALTSDEIKERYGIAPSWYTAISAEIPMISTNVDTLIIAKAKNNNTKKKIKNKLTQYRKSLIKDSQQYPMNLIKIQASKVYEKGDYVFFIMLGFIDDSVEQSGDDSKILAAYQAENKKAVKAINALFK